MTRIQLIAVVNYSCSGLNYAMFSCHSIILKSTIERGSLYTDE